MISIEAYRASIGRFSGKAMYLSQRKACRKSEGIDPALILFLVMLLEVVLYGLIFMTTIIFYKYIMALFMITVTYGYSFWIVKCCSELLSLTLRKMVKNTELMSHPVLDIGNEKIKSKKVEPGKLLSKVTKFTKNFLCCLCNVIILGSCVNIIIELSSRANYAEHIYSSVANLELYSLSHLKLSQLLVDGDVESNPGPVNNNSLTPKGRGRPKKTKGFKGIKPNKLALKFDNVDANNLYSDQNNLHTNDLYSNVNFSKKFLLFKTTF